jgi:ribosomal protein L24
MANRRSGTARPKRRSLKIRSGDRVQVIMSGKDRGKTGRVLRVEPAKERVYVEGLNMIKRHTRPQQVAGACKAGQHRRRRDRARGPRSTSQT